MSRGLATTETEVEVSLDALATHDREMKQYLASEEGLDDLSSDLFLESIYKYLRGEEVEENLFDFDKNSDEPVDYRHAVAAGVAESLTHVREKAVQVRGNLVVAAENAYTFAQNKWQNHREHTIEERTFVLQARMERREKTKINDEDPLSTRTKKALSRSAARLQELASDAAPKAMATVLAGGTALGVVLFGGVHADKPDREAKNAAVSYASSVGTIEHAVVTTKSYGMGGNTQVMAPMPEFDAKGYAPGNRDEGMTWSADMGIGNPFRSPETSIEEGSAVSMARYQESQSRGEHAHFIYYSFGTYAGQDFAWDVYRQNGNKWPGDLTIDMIGGPQGAEGIDKSPWGKLGTGLIGLRDTGGEQAFPPGAKIRMFYNDRDPYASGGNESFTSLMYSIAGIPHGTHEVPDRNDPSVTWTMFKDANGIEHWVAHRENEWIVDALERAGIRIMDTESANRALRALFPRNDDPNAPPPEANVREALHYGAKALDAQFGTGNFFQTLVANMPEPWKQLMDDSWNGFNHIAGAVGEAAAIINNPNVDPLTKFNAAQRAFSTVMGEINKIMGEVDHVIENALGDGKNFVVNTARDQIKQYTGMDFGRELNMIADQFIQYAAMTAQELATANASRQTAPHSAQQTAQHSLASLGQLASDILDDQPNSAPTHVRVETPPPVDAPKSPTEPARQTLNDIVEHRIAITPPPVHSIPDPTPPRVIDAPAIKAPTPPPTQSPKPVATAAPKPPRVEVPKPAYVPPKPAPAPVRVAPPPKPPVVELPPPPPAPAPAPAPAFPSFKLPPIVKQFTPSPAHSLPTPSLPKIDISIPMPSTPAVSAPSAPAVGFDFN